MNSFIELLLPRGFPTDLQVKKVLLTLHSLAFKIIENLIGLLRFNRLLIDLRLEIHDFDLGIQGILIAHIHITSLFQFIDPLHYLLSRLLRTLLVLAV